MPKEGQDEASVILDEFVRTTGYHRKDAIAVLNGRRKRVSGPIRRPQRKVYGPKVGDALVMLADLFDNICSRRLRAALDVELPRLRKAGTVQQTPYARALNSTHLSEADKAELQEADGHLDLLSLRRRSDELLDELLATLSEA